MIKKSDGTDERARRKKTYGTDEQEKYEYAPIMPVAPGNRQNTVFSVLLVLLKT
jgi:hypothetical protein